jgi:signal transduction histidine kinase
MWPPAAGRRRYSDAMTTVRRPAITWWLVSAGDVLLAIGLFAGSLETVMHDVGRPPLAVAIAGCATLPVAVRRRWPFPVLATITAANCASLGFGAAHTTVAGPLCEAVGIYTVVRHRSPRPALTAAGAALAAMTLVLLAAVAAAGAPTAVLWSFVPTTLMTGVIAGAAGAGLRLREVYLVELEARARTLEREREANEARAVLEERASISRELHDVVAHHLSVIVLQAGAALTLLGSDGHPAQAPVATIERSGREALLEMRRMLGVLRSRDDPRAPLVPAVGLDQLDSLVAEVRSAGLPVEILVEGQRRSLQPDLDRSAYRIVQEALSNCLRHAGPARAVVRVGYGRDVLEVEITDTGPRRQPVVADGTGHGLIGMRERAALLGGDFEAGPRPEGGFTVRARLPYPSAS